VHSLSGNGSDARRVSAIIKEAGARKGRRRFRRFLGHAGQWGPQRLADYVLPPAEMAARTIAIHRIHCRQMKETALKVGGRPRCRKSSVLIHEQTASTSPAPSRVRWTAASKAAPRHRAAGPIPKNIWNFFEPSPQEVAMIGRDC